MLVCAPRIARQFAATWTPAAHTSLPFARVPLPRPDSRKGDAWLAVFWIQLQRPAKAFFRLLHLAAGYAAALQSFHQLAGAPSIAPRASSSAVRASGKQPSAKSLIPSAWRSSAQSTNSCTLASTALLTSRCLACAWESTPTPKHVPYQSSLCSAAAPRLENVNWIAGFSSDAPPPPPPSLNRRLPLLPTTSNRFIDVRDANLRSPSPRLRLFAPTSRSKLPQSESQLEKWIIRHVSSHLEITPSLVRIHD
jgi:hypothetical protein